MNTRRVQHPTDMGRPVSLRGVLTSPYYQNVLPVMECEVGFNWMTAGTAGELYRRFMEVNKQLWRDNRPNESLSTVKDTSMVLPELSGTNNRASKHRQSKFIIAVVEASPRKPSFDGDTRIAQRPQRAKEKQTVVIQPIQTRIFCTDHIEAGRVEQQRLILERSRSKRESKKRAEASNLIPKRHLLFDGQVLADWVNHEKRANDLIGLYSSPSKSLRKVPRRHLNDLQKTMGRCDTELPYLHTEVDQSIVVQDQPRSNPRALLADKGQIRKHPIHTRVDSDKDRGNRLLPYLRQYCKEPIRAHQRSHEEKLNRSHYISDSVLVKCREIRSIYRIEKERLR